MGVVIDATEKFALRTASWMLKQRYTKEQATERLQVFSKEHIQRIGAAARKLRGRPPIVPPPEGKSPA